MIDLACGQRDVGAQRAKLIPRARGRVLEIGIGTGLNLAHYDRARVSAIVGVDPASSMRRLAAKRIEEAGLPVELLEMSAETIPSPDESFDTVVMTYTLCSIAEPLAALREMRRVLKPGGELLFCEHGRAPDEGVRRWQRRLEPVWSVFAGGCRLTRDVPALLEQGGFSIRDLETGYLPGPRPFTYQYRGAAGLRPGL